MSSSLEMLRMLVDRFDPSAFDAPVGRARIRLVVPEDVQADVVVDGGGVELVAADATRVPDATLTAPRETWERMAADLRSGLDEHQEGRLVIRDNLHLGVGFLAAT